MKLRVIGIHGIHSKEGDNSMSQFVPGLRNCLPDADVQLFEYGFMGFWEARWDNDEVAERLAAESYLNKTDDKEFLVWVTHSNGGAIAYLACRDYGAHPDMVIQINPALDRWKTPAAKWVEVIHSEQDRAVNLSQWLPFHVWGDQGKVGYKGKLKNTVNHNATKFDGRMAYKDHCGVFEPSRILMWQEFVASRIESMYNYTVRKNHE
jgi:hypothetical protein